MRIGYMHLLIYRFLESFPRFFDGKRYKLINFAPKKEIVDNYRSSRKVSKLVFTQDVETATSIGEKQSGK